jgi:hypothetical protein
MENVLGAARFLAYLHDSAGIEDLPELLAAYNAGEGAVVRYGGLPPYPGTREYVRRVLLTYLLGDRPDNPQINPVDSYRWSRKSTRLPMQPSLIAPASMPRPRGIARPRTEADVFALLEQIKTARIRALRLQGNLR